jgi:hypothetical protein
MQAHPTLPRSKLGIPQEAFNKVTDADAPSPCSASTALPSLPFVSRSCECRAMHVGAAIGVERMWSLLCEALTDNRKSMLNSRLMQLVKLKQNMHLFEDDNFLSSLGVTDVLACSNFDEAVAFEEEVILSRTNGQPDVAMVDSDEEGEPEEGALEEEAVDWAADVMFFYRAVETMIAWRSVGQLHIDVHEVF